MSHTYHMLLYHLVWSTKNRCPFIIKSYQDRLYRYMGGTFRSLKCHPVQVGGMPDHIHALVSIPPNVTISEIVRNAKVSTNNWMSQTFPETKSFAWQKGYGAFSVSPSNSNAVITYIQNQETHHKKSDFKEEFIALLNKHGITFDEKYLWK
ncbi:MAG: hypothetical protein K940chlam7_00241 [Chlamydiae bacterium]|nr:hypothetical protein [Chlamydiota bacterium]